MEEKNEVEKKVGYENVTYEEWLKASRFARFRYKYSLFVLIGCWLLLLLLCYFVWNYATELATHPGTYAVKSLGVEYCYCYGDVNYYINSTTISFVNP